jgi:branched-chain amino acid transport system permease protein
VGAGRARPSPQEAAVNFDALYHQFWPLTVGGITIGAIYALVALGYTLVYGVLRLINFAHSEVFMIGTFGALLATQRLGVTTNDPARGLVPALLILGAAAIVAMAASGATAVVLELVAYRPLRHRKATRLAALISAIGASYFLQELFANWRGRDFEAFPRVLAKNEVFKLFGASVRTDTLLVLGGALVMMVVLDRIVSLTKLGRGIRAVAQDPETASLMGVNIDLVITATFLLGGIMAGGGSLLYVVFFENTKYNIGFVLGIKAFTAAVLGGIGNVRGALVGGLVIGVMENYGAAVFGSQWKDVISFTLLVVILLFRPTGILGEALGKARV